MIEIIINMRNEKVRYKEIAEKMEMSESNVRKIVTENWSKITYREDDRKIPKEKEPDLIAIEKQRREEEAKEKREKTRIIYQEAVIKILYDLGNSKLMIHRKLNLPYSIIDKVIK